MSALPSGGLGALADVSGLITASSPTSAVPTSTSSMPAQWKPCSLRLRKMRLMMPVKSTAEPRSIWKFEA